MLGAREAQVDGYITLLGFCFVFSSQERGIYLGAGDLRDIVVCRKCVLSLALPTPPAISHPLIFLSDDAVTPFCFVEVGAAAMSDELFTAQINESKYISE